MKVMALLMATVLPAETCSSFMPRSNLPEHTRTKAMRSRWRGSMFAWILNTKPVNLASSGTTTRLSVWRASGGGDSSHSASSIDCTPKLLIAEPK
ncbi:hypothetical protein D3C81_1586460 [compost metagenome]